MHLHRIPKKKLLGTASITDPKARFFAKNGFFLEKEFLSKEVSGRKVELDEVVVPSLELEVVHHRNQFQ